jgi:4-aminobutyrate aminotransferase/(S)-3-amino-2-methylpropionate transaminase
MLAIELVVAGGLEPDAALAGRVAKRCAAEGVLILTCGTYGNVIRLLPPLVIGHDLLSEGLDVLEAAIAAESGARA